MRKWIHAGVRKTMMSSLGSSDGSADRQTEIMLSRKAENAEKPSKSPVLPVSWLAMRGNRKQNIYDVNISFFCGKNKTVLLPTHGLI